MPRPEQPFASFEQTTPGPMMTALWPLADVPKKMTLVHGRSLLPLFKSRSEASTSLRGVLSPLSFDITLQDVPNRAVHRWRRGPAQRAFLGRFQSAADTPAADNPACPLQKSNPNALQDELIRHVQEDGKMSCFDFGLQFLDVGRMTYWRKRRDANFWIENASVEWHEAEAPFHVVARLTLLSQSQLPLAAGEAIHFDVTGNAAPDSMPVGSINRARRARRGCQQKSTHVRG